MMNILRYLITAATAGAAALQAQTTLSLGHADVGVAYEDGSWDLHVHDEATDTEYAPEAVILRIAQAAQTQIPDDPRYAFLGEPGDTIWSLPETRDDNLLFLGLGTEEIAPGAFVEDQVRLTLKHHHGPGQFFLYHTDAFGNPIVSMNSADGIDDADHRVLQAGGHSHANWSFTAPGRYVVSVEASGTLATDGATRSGIVDYFFEVEQNTNLTVLSNAHIDVLVSYHPSAANKLRVRVRDSAHTTYATNQVVIQSAAAAELELPPGTPFGEAGESLWVLPQSHDPLLPYLGFNTDAVPLDLYETPLSCQLTRFDGPGEFFLWQAGTAGLEVHMNTADAIDAGDSISLQAGGHAHYNWGFTKPGVYGVTLEAQGRRTGIATNDLSVETTITFYIEPLPTEPPYQVWQRLHWPTWVPQSIRHPNADPDGDGVVNVMEYAVGLHPLASSRQGLPTFTWVTETDQSYGALTFTRVKFATDLDYLPIVTDALGATDWQPITTLVDTLDEGATEIVTMRDADPSAPASMRFYRLTVALTSQEIPMELMGRPPQTPPSDGLADKGEDPPGSGR